MHITFPRQTRWLLAMLLLCCCGEQVTAQDTIVDQWRYTLRAPAAGWRQIAFDDADWTTGMGGFGTLDTPGARVGTIWQTNSIWLRKQFELTKIPARPALLIHHDEDVVVFLNGRKVLELDKWSTDYQTLPLDEAGRSALRVGTNVMAVHCKQSSGGQFIDVHLVQADQVPDLPTPQRSTSPFKSELITQWGSQVTAENAWTEYPRPQLVRSQWQSLNGHWEYAITPRAQQKVPEQWAGKILVPFALESRLSGVQRLLDKTETLWYQREFAAQPVSGQRMLLNFEAVDYRCQVWVNGQAVGGHTGGHVPFSLDITQAVKAGNNQLLVRVEDDTEGWQLNGKQVVNARGIWYTQCSGIWQTVWLETVPENHIEDLHIATDASAGSISVKVDVAGQPANSSLRLTVLDSGQNLAQESSTQNELKIALQQPKLWSPDNPHLYDLLIEMIDSEGKVIDSVKSYAGIRTVGKQQDAAGHWRFTLNGKPIFHWGPLDQGWWPDGLLTPPSDTAMLFDIEYLKAAGFNMIRKHIKVEPRRYYYHCDRLGMLLWQDQVSAGHNPPWTRLKPDPEDAVWPDEHHAQFMREFEEMIDNLENHPSIVVWVPFNEAWGQHRTLEVGAWAARRDPSRLINVASGGNFWPVGDVVDHHAYPHPEFPFDPDRFRDFIMVMGEFGGHGLPVPGHLWDANRRNWGYGSLPKDAAEYKERYILSLDKLNDLRRQGIAAGVYTQTTDVEGEINGLMTYDRKVIKMPAEELRQLHQRLFTPL